MRQTEQGVHPEQAPSGTGCKECLEADGWWLHLRRCADCGHIGCCDSSPSQHATRHFHTTGHPIIASFEPGETWFWDYKKLGMLHGPALAEPRWHPGSQPAPGPEGRVPKGWRALLN